MSLEISQQASSSDAESIPQPTPPLTAAVSIKLPPYWSNDPALWFSQVEAQFTTRGITSESTKYAHVVGSLQPEVAQEVRDLLLNPPAENPYTRLKSELNCQTHICFGTTTAAPIAKRGTIGRPKTNPTPAPNATVTWRKATQAFNYDATIFTTPSNKCTAYLSLVQGHFGYGKFGEAGRQDPGSHTNSLHNPNPLHRSSQHHNRTHPPNYENSVSWYSN